MLQRQTETVDSVSFSPDGQVIYGQESTGKILAWNSTTGQSSNEKPQAMPSTSLLTSPDGKSKLGILADGKFLGVDPTSEAYLERLANPSPDWLSPQQRNCERLAKWAAWNPSWHAQQADESEKAEQWFAARFHLRLLVEHAPEDAALAKRLKIAEEKLNVSNSRKAIDKTP